MVELHSDASACDADKDGDGEDMPYVAEVPYSDMVLSYVEEVDVPYHRKVVHDEALASWDTYDAEAVVDIGEHPFHYCMDPVAGVVLGWKNFWP